MKNRLIAIVGLGLLVVVGYHFGRSLWVPVYFSIAGKQTVAEVTAQYGPAAEERLKPFYQRAGVEYPPTRTALIGLKAEKKLELWAYTDTWNWIRDYPVLAASGGPGPKLREGDRQVPEGFYLIEGLNPNSSFHLSMKIDYPNDFDRSMAKRENRTSLGGDIFIHGNSVSIGCLAVGDEAIEELFVLAARAGRSTFEVLILPNDLRRHEPPDVLDAPTWYPDLIGDLKSRIAFFTRRNYV